MPIETSSAVVELEATGGGITPKSEKWWEFLAEFRTMCLAPDPEFRSVLDDFRGMKITS